MLRGSGFSFDVSRRKEGYDMKGTFFSNFRKQITWLFARYNFSHKTAGLWNGWNLVKFTAITSLKMMPTIDLFCNGYSSSAVTIFVQIIPNKNLPFMNPTQAIGCSVKMVFSSNEWGMQPKSWKEMRLKRGQFPLSHLTLTRSLQQQTSRRRADYQKSLFWKFMFQFSSKKEYLFLVWLFIQPKKNCM